MKKKFGLGLLISMVAAGIVFAGSAFAADPTPTPPGQNYGAAFCGGGGMMGGGGLVDATRIASALGISVEDMTKELQNGKSIAQIAQDKNVDIQKVVDTILAPKKEMLQVMVKYGYLTQDQANNQIQIMETAVKNSLNNPGIGGAPGRGGRGPGMMGKGGFGGPRGGQGTPAPNTAPNSGSSFGGRMGGFNRF